MVSKKRISIITQFILLIFVSAFAVKAAGEIDASFNASVQGNTNANINVIKTQPDGKILVAGIFTDFNGVAKTAILRLNADGTLDTTFNPPDIYNGFGIGASIYSIGLQSNGKIIIGGEISGINGVFAPGLKRLNPDGSHDNTFITQTIFNGDKIFDIEIQPDDKIIIGGNFTMSPNSTRNLVRLNANGTLESTFSLSSSEIIKDLDLQADGKIVVGGQFSGAPAFVKRFNADAALDDSFPFISVGATNTAVEALEILSDGKIIIGGSFESVNGFAQGRISRINTDGSLDLNFNLNNPGANNTIFDIDPRADGKIAVGGYFTAYNGATRQKVALLNSDGTLDASFAPNPVFIDQAIINDVENLAGNQIIAGADAYQSTPPMPTLVKFNADGSLDAPFTPLMTRGSGVTKILQKPDGKFLLVGNFLYANGVRRNAIAQLNADGSLDTSFVPFFNALPPHSALSVALQPDGKILVGFNTTGVGFLERLNADGSDDATFNFPNSIPSAQIYDIVVLGNGQILVGGLFGIGSQFPNRTFVKLNSNGSVDNTFPVAQPNGFVYKIFVQPDGKILAAGDFAQIGTTGRGRIARFNADGSLDASFNPPGGANAPVVDLDLQADGKIVVVGSFTALNGSNSQSRVGRFNSDGTLDTSFAQAVNAAVLAVKVQPDGKILIGGHFTHVGASPHQYMARLNTNGTLDTSLVSSPNMPVADIQLQADNKILVGGEFTKINGASKLRFARLLNNPSTARTLFDYDGDGRADVSVFRPSTNRWYIFKSSDAAVTEQTFGIAGDTVAPADYDGDGKTDIGIYRALSGDWWYLSSANGAQVSIHWGANGDIPRPSDFDGDGKADFIVFRPSNNVWYRFGSTGAVSITSFGVAGDKPVTGDFDGDGKSDLAIFRPSTGAWWYQSSIDNSQKAVGWGISTDIPAPADFDGDGRTDFAVYRPSNGVWYIINSANNSFTIFQFGISEDKPVPADYDGDGKADIAVFRPSTGTWYQQKTTAGFSAQQFGVSTDIPTENAFVP